MLSYFFGTPAERPADPPVEEGHRGIDVIIDRKQLRVDVDLLAETCGLFLQVQATGEKVVPLEDFPGGIDTLRQIVRLLSRSEDGVPLEVNDENVLNLFEAAWLLECPTVFEEIMRSAFIRSLSSRRRVELLEHLLPFTAASSPTEVPGSVPQERFREDLSSKALDSKVTEEFMRVFVLETMMWQRMEKSALELANTMDIGDFVLGPRLATGSRRICCELLRLYCKRRQSSGLVTSALQPVSNMWKTLTDRPLRAKVMWDVHLFALQCIRKRLHVESATQAAPLVGEQEEDEEAHADISDHLCTSIHDSVLLGLADLVQYVDLGRAPPNWAALLVRTLMLSGRKDEARKAFAQAFPNSPRLRLLAWRKPVQVPTAWLSDVAEHVEASEVLLEILSGYREMAAREFCDILEHVLLGSFLVSRHCTCIILVSECINDIVGACFDAARKVRAPQKPPPVLKETSDATKVDGTENQLGEDVGGSASRSGEPCGKRRCPEHWEGQHLLWRVAHLGTRLFEAAFVPQCGFLPHKWPNCVGSSVHVGASPGGAAGGSTSDGGEAAEAAVVAPEGELPCQLAPLVVKVTGSCLWDQGLLEIPLLRVIMEAGCAAPHEPILHFGQQVIMRHLWFHHHGSYFDVPTLHELWELARWPLCEDPSLIREALEYLKGTYRELQAAGATWLPEHEEALFRMFTSLDLQRLPGQVLLSPWVPAQAHTVQLMVQQQPAEQFHAELAQEVVTATESLKSITSKCIKLNNKLNIVEQRTVINKSHINEAIVVIEEYQRKKSQAAHPPRRMLNTVS